MTYAPFIGWLLVAAVPLWKMLSGLVEWDGPGGKLTIGGTTAVTILTFGALAYGIGAGGGIASTIAGAIGTPGAGSPDPPSTPTIDATVVDTSTWYVDFSAYSGDGDDAQDSIAVTVLRQSSADTLFHAVSGVQTRDTVSDNTDLKADTTYRVLGRQKGTDGGWSNADTLEVENAVAVVTGGDGIFIFDLTGDSAGVSGDAFSGTSHDSTHIQVNENADGDFTTTLAWDTVLGPVTTDTVTGLDSATVYNARIRYKDNGTWQSYDTLGVFTAAFGPHGGPNEPASFSDMAGRAFNSVSTTTDDATGQGLGSYPWKSTEAEGWDEDEFGNRCTNRDGCDIWTSAPATSAPLSPGRVLRMQYTSGGTATYSPGKIQPKNWRNASSCAICPDTLQSLYFRTAVYFDANWEPHSTGYMKTIWWTSFYNGTDDVNGPYIRVGEDGSGLLMEVNMQGTYEATEACGDCRSTLSQTDGTTYRMSRSKWYEWEMCTTLNTTSPSTKDGEVHVWSKEHPGGTRTEVIHYTDVRNRSADDTSMNQGFNGEAWEPLWGGIGGDPIATTFYVYLDHLWYSGSGSIVSCH